MNSYYLVPAIVAVVIAFVVQALLIRAHYLRQIGDLRTQHRAFRQRSDELLVAARAQAAALSRQLSGARLEVKRAERPPQTVHAEPPPRRSEATESLLFMLDAESDAARRKTPDFADTQTQADGFGFQTTSFDETVVIRHHPA